MLRVIVTGANGQLGKSMKLLASSSSIDFLFPDKNQLDITNLSTVAQYVETNRPNIIVNAAAYTNVDKAEDEPELAKLLNHKAVQNLVDVCQKNEVFLIHISTDYVFDGERNIPYCEKDIPSPKSVYGYTKLAGEDAMIKSNIDYLIIRTSWLYAEFGNNFVKTILQLSVKKDELKIVFDQVGTPTNAADLAGFIIHIIENNHYRNKKEVYHFSNEGVCSWYDFAREIVYLSEHNCKIEPCLSDEFQTKAKRPNYSVLDKTKLKLDFDYEIPYWRESLKKCVKSLKNK